MVKQLFKKLLQLIWLKNRLFVKQTRKYHNHLERPLAVDKNCTVFSLSKSYAFYEPCLSTIQGDKPFRIYEHIFACKILYVIYLVEMQLDFKVNSDHNVTCVSGLAMYIYFPQDMVVGIIMMKIYIIAGIC